MASKVDEPSMRWRAARPMLSVMTASFAFLTLDQTPRADLVPEILAALPPSVNVDEFGGLLARHLVTAALTQLL